MFNGVFARCIGEWDRFSVKVEALLDAGDTVIAVGRYGGVHMKTGREQHAQMAHIWRITAARSLPFSSMQTRCMLRA